VGKICQDSPHVLALSGRLFAEPYPPWVQGQLSAQPQQASLPTDVRARAGRALAEPYRPWVQGQLSAQPQQASLPALPSTPAAARPAVRLHPDDIAAIGRAVARELAVVMAPGSDGGRQLPALEKPLRPPSASALLTVKDLLEARPGLSRRWVYENAAACGGMRKNVSSRSPLWFRLSDVDAELDNRRKGPSPLTRPTAARATTPPAGSRSKSASRSKTCSSSPLTFDIRPRPS
jgi:hypothetical protein